MIPLACAISYALGVLSIVAAGEWERRRVRRFSYRTSAVVSNVVGYGNWSTGWLCNETSGSLTATFGPQDHTLPSESK